MINVYEKVTVRTVPLAILVAMTNRNFWGWGVEGGGLNKDQRDNLKMMVSMQLGGVELEERQPPRLEEVRMPTARVSPPESLATVISQTPFDRANHTYGKAFRDVVRGLDGDFSVAPDAVAFPRNEGELASILDWCNDADVAAIPYGGGSSVTGGVEPRLPQGQWKGALTIDMQHFNRILEIDKVSRAAHIEAGIYGPALEEALKPHGYSLRHFPQSFEFSTLGGWIATRAGGHFATLYTHIDDFVEATRVLTPRGLVESRRLPGSGAGPSPDRMFIGSEGTLGIITSAWMRLQDRPIFRAAATVRYGDFDKAAEAARLLSQSGLYPTNCRVIDAQEAFNNGIGDGSTHLLLVAFESADHPLDPWMDRALEICRELGGDVPQDAGRTKTATQGEREGAAGDWRKMFIQAPYMRDALATFGMVVETFETAVTWDRFHEFHYAVKEAVQAAAHEVCGGGLVTCRFTHVYPDGPAPYYSVIAPGKKNSQVQQWDELKAAASEAIIKHGGTITHHHSVGRDHRPWYDRQRPDLFAEALRAAKGALDPKGILNPGVLVG